MIMKDINNKIHELIESAYMMGYEDGKNLEYDLGLNDAWECARKMMLSDEDGGIALSDILKIFGMTQYSAIKRFSAAEAIAKIKEYEEKQKRTCDTCQYLHGDFNSLKKCANCYGNNGWTPKLVEDAEIKVGDEVIYHGRGAQIGAHDGSIGVVLGIEKEWVGVRFKSSWNCVGICKDTLTKTGRHFPQIEEVLEQMKREE